MIQSNLILSTDQLTPEQDARRARKIQRDRPEIARMALCMTLAAELLRSRKLRAVMKKAGVL